MRSAPWKNQKRQKQIHCEEKKKQASTSKNLMSVFITLIENEKMLQTDTFSLLSLYLHINLLYYRMIDLKKSIWPDLELLFHSILVRIIKQTLWFTGKGLNTSILSNTTNFGEHSEIVKQNMSDADINICIAVTAIFLCLSVRTCKSKIYRTFWIENIVLKNSQWYLSLNHRIAESKSEIQKSMWV